MPPKKQPPARSGRTTRSSATERGAHGAESARKVLTLLKCFEATRPRMTIDELAARLQAPRSSIYRYVALLKETGFLVDDRHGHYAVSLMTLRLAEAATAAVNYADAARPALEDLAGQTGETVLLIRQLGPQGVCIAKVESPHSMRLSYEVGAAFPLHRGAGPKVLLACLPAAQRSAYLRRAAVEHRELRSNKRAFERELDAIRERGVAFSSAEITSGVWAVAASVRTAGGPLLSVSVAGPAFRIEELARQSIERAVVACAKRLGEQFGLDEPIA